MTQDTVGRAQRYTRDHPCPICGGWDNLKRGRGERCWGFLLSDGSAAICMQRPSEREMAEGWLHVLEERRSRVVDSLIYDYRDAHGQVVHQTVRRPGKRFSQRRPGPGGEWIWNLQGIDTVLYRLPELLAASVDTPVWLAEGEKDVDRLRSLGLVATCNPMGAKKWKASYSEVLRGRRVVLLEDNDADGRAHVGLVAHALAGVAREVVTLTFRDLREHGDVSDWLDGGHTREDLLGLLDRPTPQATDLGFPRGYDAVDIRELDLIEDAPSLPVLGVPGLFILGWSNLLAAYPRTGKSELLCACIPDWLSAGYPVLYLTEEPLSMWTLRLRRRAVWPRGCRIVPALGTDPELLLDMVKQSPEPVVVVDAIRNLLAFTDENDNSEVARKINPWVVAAREHDKTLELVHHHRKGSGEYGEGIAGGHALLGAVDIALELLRDQHVPNRRRIRAWARVLQPPELLYEMNDAGSMVALGSPTDLEREDLETRLVEVLADADDDSGWQTTQKIHAGLGDPKPSVERIRRLLNALAQAEKVVRDPPLDAPIPGKTYRWSLSGTTSTAPPLKRGHVGGEVKNHSPAQMTRSGFDGVEPEPLPW